MRRRGSASIAANPVLIGAATTLVVIVAVFLAYNANSGLPFVPTYELKTEVPNAANLVRGNDVRIGGTRVGAVTDIAPQQHPDGSVTAVLTLKMETAVKPLPVDSTVIIRPRSALGLKYVRSRRAPRARASTTAQRSRCATRARSRSRSTSSSTCSTTRPARRRRATSSSSATRFAGRGEDLNRAIEDANPLLLNLTPVMREPLRPEDAARALRGGARAHREHRRAGGRGAGGAVPKPRHDVPRAGQRLAAVPAGLDHACGPPALDQAIKDFPQQRPFLANTEALFRELRPGVHAFATAAPSLADALTIGTPTLKRSVAFNDRLKPTFAALQRFAEDPLVTLGIQDLLSTTTILAPTLAHLTPVQTVCNYITLFFRNTASLLSVGDANGTNQRFMIIATPQGPNNEGGPASAPANGGVPGKQDNYLHTNPYPNTASPGQTHECEAGNEKFIVGKQVHRQRARQPGRQHREDEALMAGRGKSTDPADRVPRKDRTGANAVTVGAIVLARAHRGRLPRLHQARAVHPRLPRQGRLPVGQLDPQELAGADRGRQRRQGRQDRGQVRHQRGRRDDGDRPEGPAAAQGRHDEDPPAHLPRGQLLRRRPARHAERADHRRRRHDPDHPDGDAGAARPGAHGASRPTPARRCGRRSKGSAPG